MSAPHPFRKSAMILAVLCVGISAWAISLYHKRSGQLARSIEPGAASEERNRLPEIPQDPKRIVPVEVPITGIEESIIRSRPAGFIVRASQESAYSGAPAEPYYLYWDGKGWANYDAVAEIFPQRELAESQLKSCEVPSQANKLEVIEASKVR